jgi:hypothetical protein
MEDRVNDARNTFLAEIADLIVEGAHDILEDFEYYYEEEIREGLSDFNMNDYYILPSLTDSLDNWEKFIKAQSQDLVNNLIKEYEFNKSEEVL